MLSFGDITVMNDSIVTPSGTMPLKGAVWTATDMSRTEEKIPTVAIVLAIIFVLLCLIGLLFLLMKEKKTTGFIQVTVTSGGRHHSTMIAATSPEILPDGDGPDQHGAFDEHLTVGTRGDRGAGPGTGNAPAGVATQSRSGGVDPGGTQSHRASSGPPRRP